MAESPMNFGPPTVLPMTAIKKMKDEFAIENSEDPSFRKSPY